ncbi:Asp23/Gls24 family envelope stress response protein [Corynebacterium poyangense]|uniref:Asp23/Gls24 family envelope stress response protein n=1 Tax=Corynebacterium poyangense TaxID=2684405 RepID=A0A7H0SM15_9CORY|nr:Asp23/Gls24 family envelope stress response protein [Corynebacterium poyangense]MBZ8177701.1 Asp23/Gls24 family envelope stress response protein [Corynebacterium poyangense]QNQ89590.1 Asp23/Gls24 family envelope stress response protein [Corynebacterium poyangense]
MADAKHTLTKNTPATANPSKDELKDQDNVLRTDRGYTAIDDTVVAKIAGLAAREVSGVHALGGGASRLVGSIRESISGSQNIQQGVDVEVGESQAAVDIAIVAEYGVAIHELADAIRKNIINAIERMTGLEVTEVNVTVHDVHLDLDDDEDEQPSIESAPRVQ